VYYLPTALMGSVLPEGNGMPDLYLTIAEQSDDVIAAIAASMDTRATDPEMVAITRAYLARVPTATDVLEVGCGAGASTAHVLEQLAASRLVAVDPSPGLVARARKRFANEARVQVEEATATATGQPDHAFDAVLAHTVFSHLADPGAAMAEAKRVLRPGGYLVVFDGDYASLTMARHEADPLATAMDIARRHMIHAPYLMRSLGADMQAAGFEVIDQAVYGYDGARRPDYMLSLVRRGLDAARKAGEVGDAMVEGFVAEAQRRIAAGTFFATCVFMSYTARVSAA